MSDGPVGVVELLRRAQNELWGYSEIHVGSEPWLRCESCREEENSAGALLDHKGNCLTRLIEEHLSGAAQPAPVEEPSERERKLEEALRNYRTNTQNHTHCKLHIATDLRCWVCRVADMRLAPAPPAPAPIGLHLRSGRGRCLHCGAPEPIAVSDGVSTRESTEVPCKPEGPSLRRPRTTYE